MALVHIPAAENNKIVASAPTPRKSRKNGSQPILAEQVVSKPAPISATLTGAHRCEAFGIIASGYSPVLVLCRQLLAAGISPDRALDVYRAGLLALRIRGIGEAARLTWPSDLSSSTPRKGWRSPAGAFPAGF
jgi:hypothetical protein